MFWTKKAHQSTIFQTFECSDEKSPNSLCHFLNHKTKVVIFYINETLYTWKKRAPHRSGIVKVLSGWVKIHQIPHVIFEAKSQFFFKFRITLQCHER